MNPEDFAASMLERQDADGDGAFSLEEVSSGDCGMPEEMFTEIDSDGDGLLSLEELTASAEAHRAERAAMGPPPPPPPTEDGEMDEMLTRMLEQQRVIMGYDGAGAALTGQYASLATLDLSA